MTREELIQLEKELMEEVVKRRKLGGYSVEAAGLALHAEALYKIVQYIRERDKRQK